MKIKKNYVLNPNCINSDNKYSEQQKKSIKNGFVSKQPKEPKSMKDKGSKSKQNFSNPICKESLDVITFRPKKRKMSQHLNSFNKFPKITQSKGYIKIENSFTEYSMITKILKSTDNLKNIDFINTWYRQFEAFVIKLEPKFYDEKIWHKTCQQASLSPNQPFNLIKSFVHINAEKRGIQIKNIEMVQQIGSHRLNTCSSIDTETIDICVQIPHTAIEHENLTEKNSYLKLKTLYLSHLAVNIMQWTHVSKCHFEYLQNDPFQPILMLRPSDAPQKLLFAIHAIYEFDAALSTKKKCKKLYLCKNSIARDSSVLKNENFILTKIIGQENICQAIRLIKIWLNGQGIFSHMFSGYIITIFSVYLLEKNKLKLSMDVIDIIRVIWLNLGQF